MWNECLQLIIQNNLKENIIFGLKFDLNNLSFQ